MRKRAFILILPLTVFFIETVSFVPAMQDVCMIVAPVESSCCMPEQATAAASCNSEGNEEGPVNDCTENPDCSTCPVCYTFICPATYELSTEQLIPAKDYAILTHSYHSSYTCSVWKPPNGGSHSI